MTQEQGKIRFSLTLPADLWHRTREIAAEQGRSGHSQVMVWVREAVERYEREQQEGRDAGGR